MVYFQPVCILISFYRVFKDKADLIWKSKRCNTKVLTKRYGYEKG